MLSKVRNPSFEESLVRYVVFAARAALIGVAAASIATCTRANASSEAHIRQGLVRQTLERALIAKELPDANLLLDQEVVVVSTENIDSEWISDLGNVRFLLLSPDEIKDRANREGDFLYLRFDRVELIDESHAVISLSNTWAVASDSTTGYLSGGGFTIEYRRVNGQWLGEISVQWIS